MIKKRYNRLEQLIQLQYPNSQGVWYNFNTKRLCNKFNITETALQQILKNGMFLHEGEIYQIRKFLR